jgi:hypothetical protein
MSYKDVDLSTCGVAGCLENDADTCTSPASCSSGKRKYAGDTVFEYNTPGLLVFAFFASRKLTKGERPPVELPCAWIANINID